MAEMEDALRSCMEQLLVAREERDQIIVEAASEISSQQKKLRDLQHSLEAANKKAAKLAAENNSLCKAMDAKDKLVRELRESKAASDQELSRAAAKLDAAQKQSASLQYEARMLQKELEVRSQEREYDLRSVDAARAQQAESLKKIAQLEGECQRLRAMVRKRLPGPAALAKMRDEVEPQQQPPPSRAGASPRRPRSVTPTASPRSVTPMSPRSGTPRRAPEPDQSYAVRLRAIEDENNVLKRMLAARDTELQFTQTKYAEEASKLSAVQGQLKELTEESRRLSDAHAKSETWASALVSELDQLRAGKQGHGASSVMVSDMSLLDDFAEMERLEMASSADHQTSGHSGPVVPDKNGESLDLEHGHPEWLQDVWKLVTSNHEATGESIDAIVDGIRRALDEGPVHGNGDASDLPYDRTKVEELIGNLIDKITSTIRVSAEDHAARSESLLQAKPEFCARLEYLVHVCHDVLQMKAKLEDFIDEICLVLEYIMSIYFSNQVRSDTVDGNENDFDAHGEPDMQSATSAAAVDIQTEAQKEQIQSPEGEHPEKIQERQIIEELAMPMLDQNGDIQLGRKSSYYEIESVTADGMGEDLAQKEAKQLATDSEISAAADKLAECQETITTLSKQLQALQTQPNSGIPDASTHSPRPSSADYKPQSLGSILADEGAGTTEGHISPEKEHGEPDAAARKSTAQEQNPDADRKASAAQTVVQPLVPERETAADPRKKKRGPGLLGRMIFRKRVEGNSS
ncbi:filament-like plant protein 4 [Triticum urartu]|uniref:Filament-like plant protein 7 n=1 Tax=Triticum urartu TaxID=4572 RepID=A0A8R7UWV8_TRIUA|nr:filament-like plant protein 4 [Triticum urartu]